MDKKPVACNCGQRFYPACHLVSGSLYMARISRS
jgi:hypothetical protein